MIFLSLSRWKKLAKTVKFVAAIALLLAVQTGQAEFAAPDVLSEYQVKSAFVLNFLKFVEWPALPEDGADTPFTLCIFGDDLFGSALDLVKGRAIGGRKIVVRSLRSLSGLKHCRAVYVSASQRDQVKAIADFARNHHILTIGDTEKYARNGVMINMYLQDDKVRFEVNVDEAREARLRIDARLLNLAVIVRSGR